MSFLSSTLPIHQLNILKLFENYAFHEKNSRFHYFWQYKIRKNKNEKNKNIYCLKFRVNWSVERIEILKHDTSQNFPWTWPAASVRQFFS